MYPILYIYTRQTLDWSNRQAFEAQIPASMQTKVAVWNRLFDMPYHLFRHRVKQIALQNLARAKNVELVENWQQIPDGALVAPCDDDDWFAPDFANVIARDVSPHFAACTWTSSFIELPINFQHRIGLTVRRLFPARPPHHVCTTNNYVMRKGFTDESQRLCLNHLQASDWVMAQPPHSVPRLARRLSVMNRTLGSQTSLAWMRPHIDRAELIRKYRAYATLYERTSVDGIEWCRPHVLQMAQLMKELTFQHGYSLNW